MDGVLHHRVRDRSIAYSWNHGAHLRPLVVLHGLGDSSIHTYLPRFATTSLKDTPSLFIDLPGFGEGSASTASPSTLESLCDDVASLLTVLGIEESPVFAHSMGANITILLATKYPKLARRLILAEPLLHPAQSILAARIIRYSEDMFVKHGFQILARATSIQAQRGDLAARAFHMTVAMSDPTAMHRAASSLLAVREPGFDALLRRVTQPAFLLTGDRSSLDGYSTLGEVLPTICISNAGHNMMIDASGSTSCAILNLVN